jgi:hypothetical protein
MPRVRCDRRDFVKQGLGFGLASTAGGEAVAKALAGYQPKTLTGPELAAVKALMARLIPPDPASGGAVEAGAHVFLDRALSTFHARHLPAYRTGLAELGGLAAMPAAALDALIGRMEKGELTGTKLADGGRAFFNLLRRHTLEGFLSDPMYGGNQDFIGWKLIGFHGVQLWFSAEDQQLNARDDRPQRSVADYGGKPLA